MSNADLFVGAVSVLLGTAGLLAAVGNAKRVFAGPKLRRLEQVVGRVGARIVCGVASVALILLGIAIARGYAPNHASTGGPPDGGVLGSPSGSPANSAP